MNVLSLFDGMSCGRVALDRAKTNVTNYYASEIDKYATMVSDANYPDIIRLGDVTKWREWNIDWSSIDLVLAGSPCQGFSGAGKGLGFDDPRSSLFYVFVDVLNHIRSANPSVKFLLENVRMKTEWRDKITDTLGVDPIRINSALVSAQNRVRDYWANWEFGQPEDKAIVLADILEGDIEVMREKSKTIRVGGRGSPYGSKNEWDIVGVYKKLSSNNRVCGVTITENGLRPYQRDDRKSGISELGTLSFQNSKASTITSSHSPKILQIASIGQGRQGERIYSDKGLSCTLTANTGGGAKPVYISKDNIEYRRLTPLECERLQTVPDNYTSHVSNTQRYKMLGNGWTVDVIAHILGSGDFNC